MPRQAYQLLVTSSIQPARVWRTGGQKRDTQSSDGLGRNLGIQKEKKD
jgi:hypothetical protein